MKKKLTLRIDTEMIERAHALSAARGKSVSQFVEDYLRLASASAADVAGSLPALHPDVAAITGVLAGSALTEGDYRRHLEEKHR